ncbi:MAG: EF-P beta-lysylation protein EpmB [Methylococcaceae bacterium]|nr:EF-P beta-lysylation protein EpmB [Methylococcaceae bacterium]
MDYKITRWQQELAEAFSDVETLCRHLQIDPESLPLLPNFKSFPLRVPRGFVDCMEPGNPDDPLLKQVLPLREELRHYPGYKHDPVGDLNAVATPGVIHKYRGRVLLVATGACAVHCRYCFRRNFPYGELQLSIQKLQQAFAYIESRPEISEVILSGGDPLLVNDDKLGHLLARLGGIAHLKRIRVHSRVPVVLPSRITPLLMDKLLETGKPIVLVLHANHPKELSAEVGSICAQLRQHGITLLNQSVLLKGINDDGETLCRLSEQLFAHGVLPYYLHLLDHASGTGHFAVDEARAKQIVQHMHCNLPGYLVPKLVEEQAGAAHKLPVC